MRNSVLVSRQAPARHPQVRETERKKKLPAHDLSSQAGKWSVEDVHNELCLLNKVIEIFLVAVVSVWIGNSVGSAMGASQEVTDIVLSLSVFAFVAWVCFSLAAPALSRWLPRRSRKPDSVGNVRAARFGWLFEVRGPGHGQ